MLAGETMKIPAIPTDNLYKFMALFGIVLLISGYLPYFQAHKLTIDETRLDGEILILKEEIKWASSDIDNLKKGKQSKYIEMQRKRLMSAVQLDTKTQERDNINRILKLDKAVFFIDLWVSVALIILGFWLWYEKLQKPRDIILSYKVKKMSQNNK
jgi:hypothetical protein